MDRINLIVVLLVVVILRGIQCQVHYVPAQVLVPVFNYTVHNQTGPNYGWNIPNYGNYNMSRPSYVPNYSVYNNSRPNQGWNPPNYGIYNYSKPNQEWNQPNYGIYNNSKPYQGWSQPNYGIYNHSRPNNGYNHGNRFNNSRPTFKNNSILNVTNADGNLLVGTIGIQDKLLFNKEYEKSSRWWSGRDKVIEYPKDVPSGYLRHDTIRAIRVYNHKYNPDKAKAEIIAGGVGRQFAKIKLSSSWGHGFKFLVQIYGH